MKLLVLAVSVLILCGCKDRDEVKQSTTMSVSGHLKWTITGEDGTTISQGERDVVRSEVKVETRETTEVGSFTTMAVPLSDHFHLVLTSTSDDSDGVGLTARLDEQKLFCWEWLEVSGTRATKLQERGTLSLGMTGSRIAKVNFDTEVSLRLFDQTGGIDISKPKFRILIAKGSTLSIAR